MMLIFLARFLTGLSQNCKRLMPEMREYDNADMATLGGGHDRSDLPYLVRTGTQERSSWVTTLQFAASFVIRNQDSVTSFRRCARLFTTK